MSRYLLPCSCGIKHSVAAPQAGGTITCDCGRSVPIPGLRDLRMLAPDKDAAEKTPATAVPDAVNLMGALFAGSLLLLLGGGLVAAYCGWIFAQIDTKDYTTQVLQISMERLEEIPADKLFDLWKNVTTQPLEFEQPHHVVARQVSRVYLNYTLVAGGLAVLGLIGMVYSVRGGSAAKVPPRKA